MLRSGAFVESKGLWPREGPKYMTNLSEATRALFRTSETRGEGKASDSGWKHT